ncbi:MAG TPA: hypothetical protein VGD88_14460 [Opitutaceae bacterium]
MPFALPRRPAASGLAHALSVVAATGALLGAIALPAAEPTNRPGGGRDRGPRLSPPADTRGLSRIYFPPTPPRLRAPLNLFESFGLGRPAPAGLSAHVNELYYAPLSTRLDEGSLSAEESRRIDTYLTTKRTLQAELRRRLADTAAVEPDQRERALIAFAAEQTPRIEALEREADAIREDLIRYTDNWYTFRTWRMGRTHFPSDGTAMRAQLQLMKAAAFYQKGLSPAQRRLLREIAIEMEGYERMPVNTIEIASDANPLFFFSPDTARIRLPATPSPELAELVATYEQLKARLKQELRETIYNEDDALFSVLRQRRVETLARRQESAFAELDFMAEKIRRAYVRLPDLPAPPPLPELPPDLSARLQSHLEMRASLQRDLVAVLQEIQAAVDLDQLGFRRNEQDRMEVVVVVSRGQREAGDRAKAAAILDAFNARHLERIQQLGEDFEGIRRSIEWIGGLDPRDTGAVDRRIREFTNAFDQRKLWEIYRDYQHAVLEPGLSPAQRRLLFDGALEQLELPLPGGAFQPGGG